MTKDYFSDQPENYARYRPDFSPSLFDLILSSCLGFERAWDCATGNGQVAIRLTSHFDRIDATDISLQQLAAAIPHPRIHYAQGAAEDSRLPSHSFDLITVGQAVHWFDHPRFYREVNRVIKPGGLLALMGYGLARITSKVDTLVDALYHEVLGAYWDPERRFIDEGYQTIPFPYEDIPVPKTDHILHWHVDHLLGYINTWSAVRHYRQKEGEDPLVPTADLLRDAWGPDERPVRIPNFCRLGRAIAR